MNLNLFSGPPFETGRSKFVSLENVDKKSNEKSKEPLEEAENSVPESPIPGLPPRSHGTGVSKSGYW